MTTETTVPRETTDSARAPDGVSATDPVIWSPLKRIGFRFIATYFLLDTLPFPLNAIPWLGGHLSKGVKWLWEGPTLWVGHQVVGIEGEIFRGMTGSGDTTFDYLKLLLTMVLAIAITIVWSLVDRRRKAYPRAARWLIVGCRVYLGIVLLTYGFFKVIPTQFTTPGLDRLLQTYGSSSPMRITWTFMGLSPAYTVFSGLMEAIPGLLLFFRRTRLLGALLAVAVTTNVVMINYCFDVPVKLFSSNLLAMAIALVLLDTRRLIAFFLGNRPAPAPDLPPLFVSKRWNLAAILVGILLAGSTIWEGISNGIEGYNTWGAGRPKPEIWGIHDVETFRLDGEELPPLTTDDVRWMALVIDGALPIEVEDFSQPGRITIQRMNGTLRNASVHLDESAGTISVLPKSYQNIEEVPEGELTDILHYERPEPGRLLVRGTFDGHAIEVTLVERSPDEMQLITRGFHWINETAHNR